MSLQTVLSAYGGHGLKAVGTKKWKALCVAHGDKHPSLDIGVGTSGDVVVYCQSRRCSADSIMEAVGLTLDDLFESPGKSGAPRETLPPDRWPVTATYVYEDDAGDPVFRVLRRTSPDSGNKTFRQERFTVGGWVTGLEGVKRVLYRLPRVLEAIPGPVYICEGEKDVDALTHLGAVATTAAGGAGKWEPQYTDALRGRDVVILPDNDEPGAKHVALVRAALDGAAASVKVLALPDLPHKGDVSDWLAAGGTLEQLHGMAARAAGPAAFQSSPLRLEGERLDRVANGPAVLSFGVKFLDDAMGGITRRDLVLVGAKTGAGKTQLASNIALANCRKGKRVHYFALEAEEYEIERRIKYQAIAEHYYRDYVGNKIEIRYIDWANQRLEHALGRFEDMVDDELRETLKNLHTYYRVDKFTSKDFASHLDAIREETDLVILDHFHYVDSDDANENRAARDIVKKIRDSALRANKPVIVVGHVRKSDPKFSPLVPTEEAFHGSSDLVKIATKAIMIAPDRATDTGSKTRWSTFMQIVKCRQDSSLTRYVAQVSFDARTNTYEDFYTLGRLTNGDKEFTGLDIGEWPNWKE